MNPINQFINFFRRGKVYFIVGGIAFFYLINNFIWLRQNTYPYGPDEFKHLIYALRFFKEISLNILNIFALFSSHQSGLYPPFYYISTAIFSLFFGTSYLSLVMVNMLYFIILLFSVYFIAVKLFNNRTAVISIIIISLYPMVFRYSRFFGLDFPLIAMVSLSICCLIYSDYFTDKKFTLLSGLCLGLGTLTKWTYIIFLIGPLAFIVSKSLICENNQGVIRERRIMNFSLFLIIGALLSMIWYLPNANKLRAAKMFFSSFSLYSYKIDPGQSYHAIFQFHKFIDSFLRLINDEISLLFFLLFSFAFVFFVFKCRNRLFLILWYAFPYIFFSLPSHSEARYILPALPALALISAAGLESITYKKTKRVLYSAVLLTALIQFFDISYNSERNKHTLPFSTRIGTVYAFYCPTTESPRDWVYGPPVKKNWGLQSIVNSILRSDKDVSVSDTFFNKVGVICGDNYVGKIFDYPGALNYYFSRSAKINYNTASLLYDEEILDFIDNLRNLKYIIFISKEDSFPQFEKLDGAFNQLLSLHSAKFKNPELINLIKTSKFTNIPLTNVDDIFIKEANTDLKEFLSQTDKLRLIDKIRLPEGYYAYIYDPGHGLRGLRRGLLNLRFLKGNLYFWHKNNLINAQKIGSIVQHKNQLYNSQEAVWKLNTINDYTLQAKGVWRNLPGLTQIWQISLKDEREVDCEVAVENAGADLSDLKAAQLKLILGGNSYKYWFDLNRQGKFKNKNGGVIFKDATAKSMGVATGIDNPNGYQALFFNLEGVPEYSLAQIHYNADEQYLIYWNDLSEVSSGTPAVKVTLFKTTVKLSGSVKEAEDFRKEQLEKDMARKEKSAEQYSVTNGDTRVFLDFGQGRIYRNEKEITEGFGFYTSLFTDGYWHDSQNVLWKIERKDNSTLLARGKWVDLPLSQTWEVKLLNDGLIEWNVGLEIHEKLNLGTIQANVILNKNLPLNTLEFALKDKQSLCRRNKITSADFLDSKGTLLRYYGVLNKTFEPGVYNNYFKGQIKINRE